MVTYLCLFVNIITEYAILIVSCQRIKGDPMDTGTLVDSSLAQLKEAIKEENAQEDSGVWGDILDEEEIAREIVEEALEDRKYIQYCELRTLLGINKAQAVVTKETVQSVKQLVYAALAELHDNGGSYELQFHPNLIIDVESYYSDLQDPPTNDLVEWSTVLLRWNNYVMHLQVILTNLVMQKYNKSISEES